MPKTADTKALFKSSSEIIVAPVKVSTSFITLEIAKSPTVSITYSVIVPSLIALIKLSSFASNKGSAQETGASVRPHIAKISPNTTPL